MIKVGDRVEVLRDCDDVVKPGSKGKVVELGEGFIGIELDEEFSKGHDCDGLAKDGCGGYFFPEELKVIEEE